MAVRNPVTGTSPSQLERQVLPDCSSRSSIHDLVVGFYRELVMDDLLAPVFEEVAEVEWARHIPLLIDYWCRILLGHDSYQGTILAAHRRVHDQEPLRVEHFDRWYTLWVQTIDERWSGPYAEKAKQHAAKIGATLAHRLPSIDWNPPSMCGVVPVDGSDCRAPTDPAAGERNPAAELAAGFFK